MDDDIDNIDEHMEHILIDDDIDEHIDIDIDQHILINNYPETTYYLLHNFMYLGYSSIILSIPLFIMSVVMKGKSAHDVLLIIAIIFIVFGAICSISTKIMDIYLTRNNLYNNNNNNNILNEIV